MINSSLAKKTQHNLPPVLDGFEKVNRYWDKRMGVAAAKIMPGEFYVSNQGEMIVTVLGSCISACIRDVNIGIGGMNHFMLPIQHEHSDNWGKCKVSAATRYGNWAMEYLINAILKLGGNKKNFEVKIFGGGAVLNNMTDIGKRNIHFVTDFLHIEGLEIAARDVGSIYPRKILYFPDTGSVKVAKLRHTRNDTIAKREHDYEISINRDDKDIGEVELF